VVDIVFTEGVQLAELNSNQLSVIGNQK